MTSNNNTCDDHDDDVDDVDDVDAVLCEHRIMYIVHV